MSIKKLIRDITGITARQEENLRRQLEEAQKVEEYRVKIRKANEAVKKQKAEERRKKKEEKLRKQAEEEAKLSPKERATKKGEPWVDVIGFETDKENVRHGFFELDWNSYFIVQLKNEGYGLDGDPEEEIVERWYRDICRHVAAEEGIVMEHRTAGSLNLSVRKLSDNQSEIG